MTEKIASHIVTYRLNISCSWAYAWQWNTRICWGPQLEVWINIYGMNKTFESKLMPWKGPWNINSTMWIGKVNDLKRNKLFVYSILLLKRYFLFGINLLLSPSVFSITLNLFGMCVCVRCTTWTKLYWTKTNSLCQCIVLVNCVLMNMKII